MQCWKIGFIGAGKVGTSLGKYLKQVSSEKKTDLNIVGYFSRSRESAEWAARFTGSERYENMKALIRDSNLLFVTVPDREIPVVVRELSQLELPEDVLAEKCFCHCSGAESSEVFAPLRKKGAWGCSLHPLCAVSSREFGYTALKESYFTVEGDEKYLVKLHKLIMDCGNKVEIIQPEMKVRYHMAAVFASNLVTALYKEAVGMLKTCGFSSDFSEKALLPLFVHNAQKIAQDGVVKALTGPVERGDVSTIVKHLYTGQSGLSRNGEKAPGSEEKQDGTAQEIYRLLSGCLLPIAREKNPGRNYEEVEKVLGETTKTIRCRKL